MPITCSDASTDATCNDTPSDLRDVIGSARCRSGATSGCRIVAAAQAGAEPEDAIVDQATDTVYVGDGGGSGAITVIDGATCNASVTSGCNRPLATIALTGFPAALLLDRSTHTLYVASPGPAGAVFAVDVSDCTTVTTSGCQTPVRMIADSLDPVAIDLDPTTHTLYGAQRQRRPRRRRRHGIGDRRVDLQRHHGHGLRTDAADDHHPREQPVLGGRRPVDRHRLRHRLGLRDRLGDRRGDLQRHHRDGLRPRRRRRC